MIGPEDKNMGEIRRTPRPERRYAVQINGPKWYHWSDVEDYSTLAMANRCAEQLRCGDGLYRVWDRFTHREVVDMTSAPMVLQ